MANYLTILFFSYRIQNAGKLTNSGLPEKRGVAQFG